jgi:hypothetical protein
VRDLVNAFYNNRYAACLSLLERLRPALGLDLHLHDHVAALIKQVSANRHNPPPQPTARQHACLLLMQQRPGSQSRPLLSRPEAA